MERNEQEKEQKPSYYQFKFKTEEDASKALTLLRSHGLNAVRIGEIVEVPVIAKDTVQAWLNQSNISWEEGKRRILKFQGAPAFVAPTPQTKPATPQEILEQHEARISAIEDTLNQILGQLQVLTRTPHRPKTLSELKIREALRRKSQ